MVSYTIHFFGHGEDLCFLNIELLMVQIVECIVSAFLESPEFVSSAQLLYAV